MFMLYVSVGTFFILHAPGCGRFIIRSKKKTDWKLKPSVIIIHYGDPIKSNQYNDYTIQELSNYVKKELQKLIAEG